MIVPKQPGSEENCNALRVGLGNFGGMRREIRQDFEQDFLRDVMNFENLRDFCRYTCLLGESLLV